MKNYRLLFLFFMLMSCDLFTSAEHSREKLVKEEMRYIDWNDLDRYPLFESCDETAGKALQKSCFETTFTRHLEAALRQHLFTARESLHDTVWLHILIDRRGKVTVSDIEKSRETAVAFPQLDSVFKQSISVLPKLYPPLKRDIPVAAKFKIPVVLHVE